MRRKVLPLSIFAMLAAVVSLLPGSALRAQILGPQPAPSLRRQVFVGLPVPRETPSGNLIITPNVQVSGGMGPEYVSPPMVGRGSVPAQQISLPSSQPLGTPEGPLPESVILPDGQALPDFVGELGPPTVDERMSGPPIEGEFGMPPGDCPGCAQRGGRRPMFGGNPYADIGVGHERVALALSEMDVTQPFSNFRFRAQGIWNEPSPDRAEYLWAKPLTLGGRGPPLIEPSTNYQELRFYLEQAMGPAVSMFVDLPVRWIDPVLNSNSAGFSDLNAGTKLRIINGKCWQITQQMRIYAPTGSTMRGLGNGHLTLEPGLLARYHWSDATYFHGNLKFWIPLGPDVGYQGLIVNYAAGMSTLLYENDTWAVIPTLEMVTWSVMTGMETIAPSPVPVSVDSLTILNMFPGVRWVRDCGCQDLGLFEGYLGVGFPLTTNRWYDTMLRLDLRWSY